MGEHLYQTLLFRASNIFHKECGSKALSVVMDKLGCAGLDEAEMQLDFLKDVRSGIIHVTIEKGGNIHIEGNGCDYCFTYDGSHYLYTDNLTGKTYTAEAEFYKGLASFIVCGEVVCVIPYNKEEDS